MKPQSRDTSLEAERVLIERYRTMRPLEKLDHVRAMTLTVQQLALARIRAQHPGASERELQLRLASLWIPEDVMRRVFDWDVQVRGY